MPFQNRIEIMAPAGSFESLEAALQGGADSVYFGVGKLNMRSRATVNFSEEDLPEIVERCHEAGAKAYLTLNIIVYDEELEAVHALCDAARKAGVDAVIASDLAVISYARSIGLEVHMSVQANVCNMASVKFYAQYADVVVLASPMYYWSISGQLKCAFDRLFAVAELGPDLANPVKDAVLLMAAEGDTEENFAPVRAYYKALLDCLGWKDAGIVYAGGNMAAGDIEAHPEQLEAARQLGAAL